MRRFRNSTPKATEGSILAFGVLEVATIHCGTASILRAAYDTGTSKKAAAALRAALTLRIDANQETSQTEGGLSTIAELAAHYRLKELAGEDQRRKAFSTRAAYECYLKTWVLPRWGTHRLDQIKPVTVEEWLGGIKRARGTEAKIRNLMSALSITRCGTSGSNEIR